MFTKPTCPQPVRRPIAAAIAAALAMLTGAPASAVTYTWGGNAGAVIVEIPYQYGFLWQTPGNWIGGTAPVSADTTDVIFSATDGGRTITNRNAVSAPITLRWMVFTATAPSYTLTGGRFIIGSGGIIVNAGSAQSIQSQVVLGADQTWRLQDGAGGLLFTGGVDTGTTGPARKLSISVEGTAGPGNAIYSTIFGAGSLTKTGSGRLTLTGSNTYTGGTTFAAGVLNLGADKTLGTAGTLTFAGGTLQYSDKEKLDYSTRFSPAANQAYRIDMASGANITFAGALSSSGGVLTKTGEGELTLSGANSYTGGTVLAGGGLKVNSTAALGSTGLITFSGGTLKHGASNIVDYSARFASALNTAYKIDVETLGRTVTFASGLNGSGSGLRKQGEGALTLAGASTYTGSTTVSAGLLTINANVNSGANATLLVDGSGSGVASVLVSTAGSLATGAAVVGLSGRASFSQTAGSVTTNGKLLTIGSNAGSNGTFSLRGDSSTLSTGSAIVGRAGTGTVSQSGGSFTTNINTLTVGSDAGSSGTFNLSGSSSSLSTGNATVGLAGNGTFVQSGGRFTTNGNTLTVGSDTGSSGTFNLSGSTSDLSTGNAIVGRAGSGTFLQSGGSFTANALYLGFERGTTAGTYNLSGGSLTTALTQVSNNVNTSVFTQSGGAHTTAILSLATANGLLSAGTYNLNGGTLTAGQVVRGGGAGTNGTSTFNFNGGTLRANAASGSFLQGLTVANVQAGGARIDTNGFNITIAQALVHDTTSGAPAIDGGLTKLGAGTLTLTGASSFSGALNLVAGTLAVATESNLGSSSAVTVGGGGSLRFYGGATLTRTYNLGVANLAVGSGDTLTFGSGAIVSGGFLSGPGTSVLGSGSTLNGVTAITNTALTQASGTATVNTSTIRGALTQTGGTLAFNNSFVAGSGRLSVGGTVNTTGTEIQGVTTIHAGGTVANSDSSLYLTGGSRTTVNSGGTLSTATGTAIELNGSLLVNNGTQSGTLAINYGSLTKGAGSFGTVNVSDGGRFSPGNSPGTATAENFSFEAGGRYDFELNTANPRRGIDADLLTVTNALSVGAGTTPNSVFTVAIHSLNQANQAAPLGDFDSSRSYQFLLVDANTVSGFAAANFNVDTSSFLNGLNGGSFGVSLNGNDLYLDFSPAAVPEPATWLTLAAGLLLIGARLQRRRAVAAVKS